MQIVYSILLLLAFYLFVIAEFFLPTSGLLAVMALVSLVSSVIIAFSYSFTAGVVLIVVVCLTTPIVLITMVRVWPHTPIGRRMLNRRPGETSVATQSKMKDGKPLHELHGKIGVAKTNLLPSGMVLIDGVKIDAMSIGMPIDAGTSIIVTSTDANRVKVRAVTDDDYRKENPIPQSPPSLEEPLESFDLD